jgi:hypothetical protein
VEKVQVYADLTILAGLSLALARDTGNTTRGLKSAYTEAHWNLARSSRR